MAKIHPSHFFNRDQAPFGKKPDLRRLYFSLSPILLFTSILLLFDSLAFAQNEIPLGSWRMHISYNCINSVATGENKIFGATKNGILIVEKADNSLNTYSKLNGLSATGISFINYSEPTDQLVVAYDDGNIDIAKGNEIINFDRLKNSSTISGSKRINHISMRPGYAYLSTDYGLVVFDLYNTEVKETWRDLGVNGDKLKINQSTFKGDSIFLATEKGMLVGNLNDNLLDFNSWKRFDQGAFSGAIQYVSTFNDRIYAAINNVGIYSYENGTWSLESFLQNSVFSSVNVSTSNLLITESNNLWKLNSANEFSKISDPLLEQPLFALADSNGYLWIGDAKNGLVSNASGKFASYLPNGPKNSTSLRLKYYDNSIYSLPGGYSPSFQALGNTGGFDVFNNGTWENKTTASSDLTDAQFTSGVDNYFVSSFGFGLEERNNQGIVTLYNEDNSPLVNLNPPGRFVNISSIENSPDGLWVANYGALNSIHFLKGVNSWESFSFPAVNASRYPTELLVDVNDYLWMVLNPSQGGGLFVLDKETSKSKYLTDLAGEGALPSKSVRSIAKDRDGYVWVGTDSGVAYFIDPYNVFSPNQDAVKPIFENRYLLTKEKITSIKVDGANRKWIGTEKGVWLFNSTGEKLIYNFTEENSPLLSNIIRDIEVHPVTGEVFFATDKGIVSYRSDATEGSASFKTVKIFPNPVTNEFVGTIGISGLASDATVKITDISGKLVWQTQANGGTASWNAQDYNGRRASTGIYIVFAATQDGTESAVGKIAIIE